MKFPQRLEFAIEKLYLAFHGGSLNPENCYSCAVGSICNNQDHWKHFTEEHGSLRLSYIGRVHEALGRRTFGYSPYELLQIEASFLKGCGYSLPFRPGKHRHIDPRDKEVQFKGLCEVVAFLCALDGVENVMDISRLFEFEHDRPVHALEFRGSYT